MNKLETQALYDLTTDLRKKIDGKVYFVKLWYGRYLSPYRVANKEFVSGSTIDFSIDFSSGSFLRIGVSSLKNIETSIGERMAALSDFYTVLSKEYGEPKMFYITKDFLGYEHINLQWMFNKRDKKTDSTDLNEYLDDQEDIKSVIMLGNNTYSEKMATEKFLLPAKTLPLISMDLENYIMHRGGKGQTEVDNNVNINIPYPIGTYLTCNDNGQVHIDKVLKYIYDRNGLSVIITEDIFTDPRSSIQISIDEFSSRWQVLDLSQKNSKKRVKEKQ